MKTAQKKTAGRPAMGIRAPGLLQALSLNEKRIQILLFCLCFLVRAVPALFSVPVSYVSDEVSAISAAALAAGQPWKDVIANAGYYGFGFLILFAPLFKLHLGAASIYRCMLVVLAAVDAAGALLCYRIQLLFFREISREHRILNTLLCFSLLFFSLPDFNVRNENILILLSWILAYCLCLLVYGRHTGRAQAGILFVLLFSQTVHSRAIILTIGILLITAVYFIFYRKKLLRLPFFAVLGIGTLLVRKLISLYMGMIWTGEGVRNSSVSNVLVRSAKKLNISLTYISCILRIAFGQVYTAAAVSLGLFLLAAAAIVLYIFRKRRLHRDTKKERLLFVLGTMFLGNILLTIGGQSLTWSNGVYNGVVAGTYAYSYKAFTYLRYFGFNVPPMVLTGSIILLTRKDIVKRATPVVFFSSIALSVLWCMAIVPLIVSDNNYYYKLIPGWPRNMEPNYAGWIATVVCIQAVIILWLSILQGEKPWAPQGSGKTDSTSKNLLQGGRWRIIALTASLFMILGAANQFFSVTLHSQEYHTRMADASVDFLRQVEEYTPAQDIYVHDGRGKTDHQTFYMAQFLNYDRHVIPGLPEDTKSNGNLVFSNRNIEGYFQEGYWWTRLDGNEYVFFRDEKLAEVLKGLGYEVRETEPLEKRMVAIFYSKWNGDHFYTLREDEISILSQEGSGYQYVGSGWYVERCLTPHSIPVYRFYDMVNMDHIYTSSEEERLEYLQNKAQYRAEGIAWYTDKEGNEIYCIYNAKKKDHVYTANRKEAQVLLEEDPANRLIESGLYYAAE